MPRMPGLSDFGYSSSRVGSPQVGKHTTKIVSKRFGLMQVCSWSRESRWCATRGLLLRWKRLPKHSATVAFELTALTVPSHVEIEVWRYDLWPGARPLQPLWHFKFKRGAALLNWWVLRRQCTIMHRTAGSNTSSR